MGPISWVSLSVVLLNFHPGKTRRKWAPKAFLVGIEESSLQRDPFWGRDRAGRGLTVHQVWSSVYLVPTGPSLLCPTPISPSAYPPSFLVGCLPEPLPTSIKAPIPGHRTWSWPQILALLGSFSPTALWTRSTSETQWGLNGVYARNPLMKGREVFLNPARVPDRQLCCVTPSPCSPSPFRLQLPDED